MLPTCFSTAVSLTHEGAGNRRVGATLGHQAEHLALSDGQPFERIGPPRSRQQLCDDFGVEDGAAAADLTNCSKEVSDVGDAILQEISDTGDVVSERMRNAARRPSSVWVGGIRTSTIARSGRCISTTRISSLGRRFGRSARPTVAITVSSHSRSGRTPARSIGSVMFSIVFNA